MQPAACHSKTRHRMAGSAGTDYVTRTRTLTGTGVKPARVCATRGGH